ncbi:BrnA antitoxin family protein [Granulicella rosea]|nr:BrnA antitoxin family protein [Granulicella rosea]
MAESDAPIPYDPEDGPYDPNDDAAVDAYWDAATIIHGPGKRGPQKAPPKQLVSLRLSRSVLEYFRATGPGWQTRIDETLKRATEIK